MIRASNADYQLTSHGFRTQQYVLTCDHSYLAKDTVTFNNLPLNNMYKSHDLDLALLSDSEDQEQSIRESRSTDIMEHTLPNKGSSVNIGEVFSGLVEEIIFSKTGLNYPAIPSILVFANTSFNVSDMEGFSGSPVYDKDNKILGILSSYQNGFLNIVPSALITRFIRECENTLNYCGLCNIPVEGSICELEDETGKNFFGFFVENTFGINYGNNPYCEKRSKSIKTEDIIVKINGKMLTSEFKVYDDNLRLEVEFETYIATNFHCGQDIPLTIIRNDKMVNINVVARPVSTMLYIPLTNNYTFTIANCVFAVLTEELIKHTYKHYGELDDVNMKWYNANPYRDGSKHIVILKECGFEQQPQSLYDRYFYPVVTKLNRKHVKTISEVQVALLDNQSDTIMHMKGSNGIVYKLTFRDGDLVKTHKSVNL